MNRPGSKIFTGSQGSIGTGFTAVAVGTLPQFGRAARLRAEITAGPGTAIMMRLRHTTSGRIVSLYDDGAGSPIAGTELHFADPEVWFDVPGEGPLVFEVATDDGGGGTTVDVELEVEFP